MKISAFCFFLAVTLVLIGCRGEEHRTSSAEEPAPIEVRASMVSTAESSRQTEVAGTVRSVHQAAVAPKVTGTIEKMPVVLGAHVRTGDLLVQIAAGELSARMTQAKTRLEQADRNLARERKLLEKKAATPEHVKSLEETFRMAEAAYHETRTMLEYTTITAPFDGVVSRKTAHVGDLASPGIPLLYIEDVTRLQVVISVPEALVLHIAPGETLPVFLPAAGLELQGRVAEVAPAVDPLSRSAMVKIDIEGAPQLQPGQFARVVIPGKKSPTLYVPSAAVHRFGQMETVFVIEKNRLRLRLVRTGAVVDDRMEILAGLEPGETVALHSGPGLLDGRLVRIVQ
jgi:membrane fusion protein, multidrug efflux system